MEIFIGADRVPFSQKVIYSGLPVLDKIQREEEEELDFEATI